MKYIRVTQVVCAMASILGDAALATSIEKSDFIKTILSRGRRKLALVIQPSITRSANERLQSYADETEEIVREDHQITSIADETQEYIGPFRRKKWKKRPGSLKTIPKANFSKPFFYEWDSNGQYVGDDGARDHLSPIEVLIKLSECLNHAASLTVSPSDRYVDMNTLGEQCSWIDPKNSHSDRAEKRFDVNGEYRLIGNEVGVPDDPQTWNIFSKSAYDGLYKKNAIGMCVNLKNNQGFSVLAPRYIENGRVKKASALAQELEEKCKKHPYTFLASIFVPG